MSLQTYTFQGTGKWVTTKGKDFGDGKGPKWLLSFYPKDKATREAVKATGIRNKPQIDAETDEVYFILRNTKEPYGIVNADGSPVTVMVGNGSDLEITLEVEKFKSLTYGDSARSQLLLVKVLNLIPYVPATPVVETTAQVEIPA